jgi:magnesium transporter
MRLTPGERARVEHTDGTLLIVFLIPHKRPPDYRPADAIPYITVPLTILLTEHNIVTVCSTRAHILRDIAAGKVPEMPTVRKRRFILKLLFRISEQYLKYLREIDDLVERVEDQLQRSLQNREALELLRYQKSLVYFTTALRSNKLMVERLGKTHLLAEPEDAELLDDVLIEVQQAIALTEISEGILSQMMDAFAPIISNNLNVVMKFLASITIIISLPTVAANFYGMNVALPGNEHLLAFWVIMGWSLALSVGVLFVFWRKNWL